MEEHSFDLHIFVTHHKSIISGMNQFLRLWRAAPSSVMISGWQKLLLLLLPFFLSYSRPRGDKKHRLQTAAEFFAKDRALLFFSFFTS